MILVYIGIGLVVALLGLYLFLIAPALVKKNHKQILPSRHFAHRGVYDNLKVPENSLTAFKMAVDKGYGIELDIRLTKDGEVVVFHDDGLKRLCGMNAMVSNLSLAELNEYRLLTTDERIPTLIEVLNLVNGKVPLLVEYKTGLPGNNVDSICEKAENLLAKYQGSYIIESFDYQVLAWYRKHKPAISRGQLSMGFDCFTKALGKAADLIPVKRRKMISGLTCNYLGRPDFISYRWQDIGFTAKLCQKLGAKLVCWTPNNKADAEKLLSKYDGIVFEHFDL